MPWPLAALLAPTLALLCALAAAAAQAQSWRPQAVVLDAAAGPLEAGALGLVWMDARGSATIEEVAQGPARFRPAEAGAVHHFAPGAALWVRLRLQRPAQDPHDWLLAVPNPVLDHVTLWQQDAAGKWRGQAAGDTVPVRQWPEAGRYPSFRLELPAGQARDVYVQVRSITPTSLAFRLATQPAHAQQLQREAMALGMALGAVLLLVAACLAQSWVYRDSASAWYAGYAAVTTLGVLAYTGVAAHVLWDGSGFWADAAQGSLAALAGSAALLFVRDLTGISARHRRLDAASRLGVAAGLVLAVAYPLLHRPAGLVALAAYLVLATPVNVAVAWLCWRRGDGVGLWVLVAYGPLSLALALALVRLFGWLPASFATQYAIVVAMVLEMPLLLVALSLRSRERHGARAREQALASQDALTGLLAPHLFHDRLRQVVGRLRRTRGEHAALIVIDLVNHARIQAAFGPAVAEQSLLRTVIKLRKLVRDVDTLSRIGEARFALLMEGVHSRAVVTDRAARLIAAGLVPLPGLKHDVTLQFHAAAVLLAERPREADTLLAELDALLAGMSPRTRRPIRFLVADAAEPPPEALAADSGLGPDVDSQPGGAPAFSRS